MTRIVALLCALLLFAVPPVLAQDDDDEDGPPPQVSCPQNLLHRRIAVIVGEQYTGTRNEKIDEGSGFLANILNEKLSEKGFTPIDQKTIDRQVAARQRQLILSGDIVAASKAGSGMGADLVLTGIVSSRASDIKVVKTNFKTVNVRMALKIIHGSGKVLASKTVTERGAGLDPLSTAIENFSENADRIVAQLLTQYCANAPKAASGPAAKKPAAKDVRGDRMKEGDDTAGDKDVRGSRVKQGADTQEGGADAKKPKASSVKDL